MADFWANSTLEPKRKHRFLLFFNNFDLPQYVIKSTDKPSFEINTTTHNYFGHQFHYPGQVVWNTINVTLVDPVSPDSSTALNEILRKSGYGTPDDAAGDKSILPTISKASAVSALGGKVIIRQYDVEGQHTEAVESWELYNPWIQSVNYGSLDYASDDMLEITLTLRYDWAKLEF
jgi:hypothetical protein